MERTIGRLLYDVSPTFLITEVPGRGSADKPLHGQMDILNGFDALRGIQIKLESSENGAMGPAGSYGLQAGLGRRIHKDKRFGPD